jgi:hypothetical protein
MNVSQKYAYQFRSVDSRSSAVPYGGRFPNLYPNDRDFGRMRQKNTLQTEKRFGKCPHRYWGWNLMIKLTINRLRIPGKGEQTAQACEKACFQQTST